MPGMNDDTEKNILDSIPDLMSDGNATETDNTTEASTTDSGEAGATKPEPAAGGATPQSSEGSKPNTPAPTDGGIVRRDGLVEVPNKDNPNARDLVDPKTGDIVALGGRERGMFERAQRAHHEARQQQQRAADFEKRATTAEATVAANNEINTLVRDSGLQHADHKIAVQLMGRFLKDPVTVLGDLVAEVKAKGYNIPFLETGITPGIDAAAMQRMMDERFKPITEAKQQEQEVLRVQNEARTALDNFLASEPDAMQNIGIIGEMLTQDRSLTLTTAWTKLLRMTYEAGLDPSQPLKPQYEAKIAAQTAQPASTAQTTPTASRPLPNGRAAPQAAVPVQEARQFDENSSMSDIIRHAMRESGFAVN